jgi:glutathione S-transferase
VIAVARVEARRLAKSGEHAAHPCLAEHATAAEDEDLREFELHSLDTAEIAAKLYWFPLSHPSHAVRAMLEAKGIDYDLVDVLPGNQRIHLRLAGFRGGTVPAMKLDGKRVQGSTRIARALDQVRPDPPLFPTDPERRRRVEDAERWGDREFQDVPRRILRYALTQDVGLRKWLAEQDGTLPAPGLAARLTAPVSSYYAWVVRANKERAQRDVADLPSALDRVDALIEDRVIGANQLNSATYQVLCTVRSLLGFSDFEQIVGARSFAPLARQLFPHFPEEQVPPFVERLGLR